MRAAGSLNSLKFLSSSCIIVIRSKVNFWIGITRLRINIIQWLFVRQLSGSSQAVIRQSSGSCQVVSRQSSAAGPVSNYRVSSKFVIDHCTDFRPNILCSLVFFFYYRSVVWFQSNVCNVNNSDSYRIVASTKHISVSDNLC